MEEMADAGEDDHGQVLRPRPRERRGERNELVALAVDDDRIRWHGAHRLLLRRRPDEDDPARPGVVGEPRRRLDGTKPPNEKPPSTSGLPANSSRRRHSAITASASSTSPTPSSHI